MDQCTKSLLLLERGRDVAAGTGRSINTTVVSGNDALKLPASMTNLLYPPLVAADVQEILRNTLHKLMLNCAAQSHKEQMAASNGAEDVLFHLRTFHLELGRTVGKQLLASIY